MILTIQNLTISIIKLKDKHRLEYGLTIEEDFGGVVNEDVSLIQIKTLGEALLAFVRSEAEK